MDSRVVVITGATGGIGSATARRFAKEGEFVVLVDHPSREERLREFAREINLNFQNPSTAFYCTNDIMDTQDVERCVNAIVGNYGKIDVLVNVAGAVVRLAPLVKLSDEELERSWHINFLGTAAWCRAVLPHMRTRGEGAIVNVASVVAEKGDAGNIAYASAKAAVKELTQSLALEGPKPKQEYDQPFAVRVNAVAPGIIDTDMTKGLPEKAEKAWLERVPLKRKGRPEEVAAAIHFLASSEASFINGVTLRVDGGYSIA